MGQSLHTLRMHARIVSWCSLPLVLFLCIAFVHHETDYDVAHHHHHVCQHFSNVHNALPPHVPDVPVWSSHVVWHPLTVLPALVVQLVPSIARAPPSSLLKQNYTQMTFEVTWV